MDDPEHSLTVTEAPLELAAGGDVPAMLLEDLGPRSDTDARVEASGVRLSLGTHPLAYDVRALHRAAGIQVTDPIYSLFDVWLVVHHVGVIAALRSRPVLALRYEADFGSEPITTRSLSPELEIKTTQLGTLAFSSVLEANGHLRAGGDPEPAVRVLPLGGGLKLNLGTTLKLEGTVDLCKSVIPVVHSAGLGSPRCEWYFRSAGEPIAGSQTMAQVLFAPRATPALKAKLRAEIVLGSRVPGLVTSHHTAWVDVECKLIRA